MWFNGHTGCIVNENSMDETEKSQVTLVLIDVINGFDFEDEEELVAAARHAAPHILALRERAHAAGVPVVYANESFGHPGPDFEAVVSACSATERPGHNIARMLAPTPGDHALIKPGRSAFSNEAFDPLLRRVGTLTVVLVGFATDSCVLATARDASACGYEVLVPPDCTAANSTELAERAFEQMRAIQRTSTPGSLEIDLAAMRHALSGQSPA